MINRDKLLQANQVFTDTFMAAMAEQGPSLSLISAEVPLNGTRLVNGGTRSLGQQRTQVVGEDQIEDDTRTLSSSHDVETIYRRIFLNKIDVEGDSSGYVGRMLAKFIDSARFLPERAIWEAFAANAKLGPDGLPLFSTAHPFAFGGGTESNKTTDALSVSAYAAAKAAMSQRTDESGQVLNIRPSHLFVAADLEHTAKEITGATRIVTVDANGVIDPGAAVTAAAGASNGFQGDLMTVVVPYLAPGAWAIASTSAGMPYSHGFLRAPEAIPSTDFEAIERTGKVPYVISADMASGPENWQLVYGNL